MVFARRGRGIKMKNIINLLLICCILAGAGCAYVSVKKQDPMELWGADAKIYDGRVYSARSWHRPSAVKKIARIAKKNGYNYFALLRDDKDFSGTYGGSYGDATISKNYFGNIKVEGSSSGYSMAQYNFTVLALFLHDDELKYWKNIYSVSNYTK